MKLNQADVRIDRITGQGPGGQHRNKTASCIRATHVPTGIVVTIDGRNQHANLRKAMKELDKRVTAAAGAAKAAVRKQKRDKVIHDRTVVRTYDYKSQTVRDHRTGRRAPLKDVLFRGRLDLIIPTPTELAALDGGDA